MKPIDMEVYDTCSTKFLWNLYELPTILRYNLHDQIVNKSNFLDSREDFDQPQHCSTNIYYKPKKI